MKLKITTNFSFNKLAQKMPELLKKYSNKYAMGAEVGTRNNIKDSVNIRGQQLKSFTARRQNRKPLIKTGNMNKSIKSSKNTLSILEYGYKHNQGLWDNVRPETDLKDFIGITKEYENTISKKFIKNINSALKK
tara:strand:+ start:132 stop:533 length:402 start_codon:yes stop_codon:yes gene_type:complete